MVQKLAVNEALVVETQTKTSVEAAERTPAESSVLTLDKAELLSILEETRAFMGEYRLVIERVSDSNEWNQEALHLVRTHRSLSRDGLSPLANLRMVVGLFQFMAHRLRQDSFEFRIPTKVGLIPELENPALREFSGQFRLINVMLNDVVSQVAALSEGELSHADDRVRRLLLALCSFLKSLVRQDWDDLALFMTHINLITTSAESHEIVGQIAKIARDIYNSLNEFSRFLNVESLSQTTEELPDAVENLQTVIDRLEDAANTNLDKLEELNQQAGETKDWLAHSRASIAANWEEIERLKAAHPEMEEGLAAVQKLLREDVDGALEDLEGKTEGYINSYMTMIGNQSFQDLTGQTLKKVIKFIETMQFKLVELLPKNVPVRVSATAPNEQLPPVEGDANKPVQSQEQVDQLLADLGF